MENTKYSSEIEIISSNTVRMISSKNEYIKVLDSQDSAIEIKFNEKGKVKGYYFENRRVKNVEKLSILKKSLIQGYPCETLHGESTFIDIYLSIDNFTQEEKVFLKEKSKFRSLGIWCEMKKIKDEPFDFETLHNLIETSWFED